MSAYMEEDRGWEPGRIGSRKGTAGGLQERTGQVLGVLKRDGSRKNRRGIMQQFKKIILTLELKRD